MNNLSSYCGLVDAKIRASDKDLPVHIYQDIFLKELTLQHLYIFLFLKYFRTKSFDQDYLEKDIFTKLLIL